MKWIRFKQSNVLTEYGKKNRLIPQSLYKELKARKKCRDCGKHQKKGDRFEIHHIKPLSEGGQNIKNNLILLCQPCHAKRHQTKTF